MRFLLDTCALSELVKRVPEPNVLTWMRARQNDELFVSAITLAELQRDAAKLPVSRRRDDLSVWLQQLEAGFEDRVLPFTGAAAHYWAQVCVTAEAKGRKHPANTG